MKYLVGFAVLALGFAMPAYAGHAAGGGGTGLPASAGGTGGSGIGSGAGGSARLPHYSRTKFQVTAVSGSENDYIPSTFVSYNKALTTTGQTAIASAPETLGEAAQLNRETPKIKAKFTVVQDNRGNAVIEPR